MACSMVMTFAGKFGMTPSRIAVSIDVASAGAMDGDSIVLFEITYLWMERPVSDRNWRFDLFMLKYSHLIAEVEEAEGCT
jgi:hypothetical protein